MRQHGAAFERHRGAAVLEDLLLEHVGRGREGALDVAIGHGDEGGDVAREIAVGGRRAGRERVAAIAHRRQHLVVDRDRRGGILGEIAAVGDDHGDRLADIADLAAGERMLGAQRRDGGIGDRHRQRLGCEPARHVLRGEHRMDARHRVRGARIDRTDARVGMRAAHERGVEQAGELHVVDEVRAPGEQGRVLDPQHAGAELPRAHVYGAPSATAMAAEWVGLFIAISGRNWRPRVGRYRRARQAAGPHAQRPTVAAMCPGPTA